MKDNDIIRGCGISVMPKFAPADIIDLGVVIDPSKPALPNRIYIHNVFFGETNSEWMYEATSESSGKKNIFNEKFILDRMSHRSKRIYSIDDVARRYQNGYRWAGDYPDFIAKDKALKLVPIETIDSIMLHRAIYPSGGIKEGYLGIWIRYTTIIGDNGVIMKTSDRTSEASIVIK